VGAAGAREPWEYVAAPRAAAAVAVKSAAAGWWASAPMLKTGSTARRRRMDQFVIHQQGFRSFKLLVGQPMAAGLFDARTCQQVAVGLRRT